MAAESLSRDAVLDDIVRASLTGAHEQLAQRRGRAVRYQPGVAGFAALPDDPQSEDWADLAVLAGEGAVALVGCADDPPPGWTVVARMVGVQMIDEGLETRPDARAVRLTSDDVPEMLDLVARTNPGPFWPRTIELGTYLGFWEGGTLLAMAGERMHPPGWTEVSAVATAPEARGRGLATRLIRAVAHGIRERGETPLLHAVESNTNAIRLYESLGFRIRRPIEFLVVQPSPAS
jgi:ribosomal protein S18 acetylase RimI-like enzyme